MHNIGAPSSPEQLRIVSVEENSVTFAWQAPENVGNPPLITYQLVLVPVTGPAREHIIVNVSAPGTEALVKGLLPLTTYSATVTGISAMFVGLPSARITGTDECFNL